jgi:ZIP family zinc transporter
MLVRERIPMIHTVLEQSLLAGLATVLGALLVAAAGRPGERLLASLLGFAGGVMTAVIVFDLIPSALAYGSLLMTSCGFLSGLFFMLLLDLLITLIPGLHKAGAVGSSRFLKMGCLIAVGIALHDLPEGVAIAVSYTAQESLGLLMALAIGLHNIPEGMAASAPLTMGGVSKKGIILTCFLISLFTPLGALLGLMIMAVSRQYICLLLALAGGAMAFIVQNELLPESQRHHTGYSRFSFIVGVVLILAAGIYQGV